MQFEVYRLRLRLEPKQKQIKISHLKSFSDNKKLLKNCCREMNLTQPKKIC